MKKILESKENQGVYSTNIFIFLAMILSIVFIIAFIIFFSKSIFAISQNEIMEIDSNKIDLNNVEANLNIFNIDNLLEKNSNIKIEKELIVEKNVLEYTIKQQDYSDYRNDEELAISNLDFNMNLNKTSGLSLDKFKSIFENDSNDTNNIFYENAEYFYYAEKQYNINGIFLAAVAIHESGWGTSKLFIEKKNLFGYRARDSNPFENAYSFDTYSECIDLLTRFFVKYYINEKGTDIYDGEVASGKYYNGSTLQGINVRYASDKKWANSVYKWMKYLYSKI